jgi:hypothetical protein
MPEFPQTLPRSLSHSRNPRGGYLRWCHDRQGGTGMRIERTVTEIVPLDAQGNRLSQTTRKPAWFVVYGGADWQLHKVCQTLPEARATATRLRKEIMRTPQRAAMG